MAFHVRFHLAMTGAAAALFLVTTGLFVSARDCSRETTQAGLNACVAGDAKLADQALNHAYQRLSAGLSGESRGLLRDAERAWIHFRDKHCAFVGSGTEGGSVQAMVISDCIAETTNARAMQLLDQLYCAEGDMSCAR